MVISEKGSDSRLSNNISVILSIDFLDKFLTSPNEYTIFFTLRQPFEKVFAKTPPAPGNE